MILVNFSTKITSVGDFFDVSGAVGMTAMACGIACYANGSKVESRLAIAESISAPVETEPISTTEPSTTAWTFSVIALGPVFILFNLIKLTPTPQVIHELDLAVMRTKYSLQYAYNNTSRYL